MVDDCTPGSLHILVVPQIKWGDGWHRADGTNTTWEKADADGLQDVIAEWKRKRTDQRTKKAQKSPEIEIGVGPHNMLHEDRTIELARGYEELRKIYLPNGMDPRQPIDFDGMRKKVPGRQSPPLPAYVVAARASAAERSASERSNSQQRKSKTPASSSSPSSSSSRSPSPVQGRRQAKPAPRRAVVRRAISSPCPDSEEEPTRRSASRGTSAGRQRRQFKRRKSLELKWARKLQGAKPVTIVNEVNYEEVPPFVESFEYLERGYVR